MSETTERLQAIIGSMRTIDYSTMSRADYRTLLKDMADALECDVLRPLVQRETPKIVTDLTLYGPGLTPKAPTPEDTVRVTEALTASAPGDAPTEPKITLTDGSPVTPDHREINPATGQQKGYVVLSETERAKGFVRPLRFSYRHVGARPKHPLRDLTAEEHAQYDQYGYVKYEVYPESESPQTGRFWTQEQLRRGCGVVTTMGRAIAETYARNPKFYGGTFCCGCQKHLPLEEFVWDGTEEIVGS